MRRSELAQQPNKEKVIDPELLHYGDVILLGSKGDLCCINYPRRAATRLVRKGRAYVISSEAIAFFEKEKGKEVFDCVTEKQTEEVEFLKNMIDCLMEERQQREEVIKQYMKNLLA